MKYIILIALLGPFSFNAVAGGNKILIADETFYTESGSTGNFRVVTSNTEIAKIITDKVEFTRMTASQKQDRHGKYWEYSFYFNAKQKQTIISLFKHLNKQP